MFKLILAALEEFDKDDSDYVGPPAFAQFILYCMALSVPNGLTYTHLDHLWGLQHIWVYLLVLNVLTFLASFSCISFFKFSFSTAFWLSLLVGVSAPMLVPGGLPILFIVLGLNWLHEKLKTYEPSKKRVSSIDALEGQQKILKDCTQELIQDWDHEFVRQEFQRKAMK